MVCSVPTPTPRPQLMPKPSLHPCPFFLLFFLLLILCSLCLSISDTVLTTSQHRLASPEQVSKKINYDALLDLDLAAAQTAPLAIMDTPNVDDDAVEKVSIGS